MFKTISNFFSQSFQRKLLFFNISLVIFTTVILFLFLINNFQTITNFSLDQNTTGMERTIEDYLTNYAQEKATSTWLQLKAAQDNLTILGRTAQKVIDNYDEIQANPAVFDLPLFQTQLREVGGALSSRPGDPVDTLIPPPITSNPQAKDLLSVSALLNLSIDAIYEANSNNIFVYFVGNPTTPVTRAYPNIGLAEVLGDDVSLLFWQDFFAQNVDGWQRWYTDPALQARIPNPITVEPPYQDAAGQGMIVTMFYPLWNKTTNEFAGAAAADISLNNIIENVLSIQVGQTGFAFLMNGSGELIAMPESGYRLFNVNLTETELGGLLYYTGTLDSSDDPDVREMAATILDKPQGVFKLEQDTNQQSTEGHLVAFASLPALADSQYQEDRWHIAIVVPEAEMLAVLYETDAAIRAESQTISLLSLGLVLVSLIATTVIAVKFSNNVTRDLRTLAQAADQVSAKNYDVKLDIKSQDEIGQLGRTFEGMTREIQAYTTNLEAMVAKRTSDLQRANEEITRLNDQLKDENLRLSAELNVARQLQMMVLPPDTETQAIQDLDIACYMRPADEVGGDYYDVLQIDGSVFMGIGDVTGHGLPAGVIMLMAQTAFLTLSQSGERDMERILSLLNQVIYRNIMRIREDKNMTLAVMHYRDRKFQIVGQHESVLICRKGGQVEEIDTVNLGFPLGLEDNIDDFIAADQFHLDPGDVMLLYTDGVTEAESPLKQLYGMSRLTEALVQYHHLEAQAILDHVMDNVYRFIDNARINDDISMLIIKQK